MLILPSHLEMQKSQAQCTITSNNEEDIIQFIIKLSFRHLLWSWKISPEYKRVGEVHVCWVLKNVRGQ